jgi:hypothetical protein
MREQDLGGRAVQGGRYVRGVPAARAHLLLDDRDLAQAGRRGRSGGAGAKTAGAHGGDHRQAEQERDHVADERPDSLIGIHLADRRGEIVPDADRRAEQPDAHRQDDHECRHCLLGTRILWLNSPEMHWSENKGTCHR